MSRFFGRVCQNGYVVRDIEAALKHWTGVLGIGPFFYAEHVQLENFRYHGEPFDLEMSVALTNSGDLQIELIQQRNDAHSMYRDFLNSGCEGLHHMSYWTTSYQEDYDRLIAHGFKVGHEGLTAGGPFVYFDTEMHPGTVIELSDISGSKGDFFEYVRAAAENWDGADPVRKIG